MEFSNIDDFYNLSDMYFIHLKGRRQIYNNTRVLIFCEICNLLAENNSTIHDTIITPLDRSRSKNDYPFNSWGYIRMC